MHEEALEHLGSADRTLGRLIGRVGGCAWRPSRQRRPLAAYQALVEAVAHQQLTGKAAQTILGRMKALFPDRDFPTPEELLRTPDAALRGAGFSGGKVAALKDIAAKTVEGIVPATAALRRLEDEAIIERLTAIRGVGRWTVEMLLIFELGRPDVLPAADYGVRKGFALTYRRPELPQPKELAAFGERWRPHRSIAAWYMWRALELPRRKKTVGPD